MPRSLSALVIGNANYASINKLKNPANDATDISDRLKRRGFDVTTLIDITHKEMDRALREFETALVKQKVGLFFFAGHGFQIDGENYLAAADTIAGDEVDAKHSSLALDYVIARMQNAETTTNIIILDACRDNPFERNWKRGTARGLAPVYAPRGTIIAYATSPGQYASDGNGRNGAYTDALLQHLEAQDCSIEAMFKRVRNTLSANTSGKQISWEHTSLAGEFYFNLGVAKRITEYAPTALSDSLFVLEDDRPSHQLISKLKSRTWPTQNPAIDGLTAGQIMKFTKDSLFVLGRNIYQSACGNSHSAKNYIHDFTSRTSGAPAEDRKALLDGMLFEVFFGNTGQIRDNPKVDMFNQLFALQRHVELADSFAFIAHCLLPEAHRFHVIPGKDQPTSVDVTLDQAADNTVTEIFIGGINVFRAEDDEYESKNGENIPRKTIDKDAFEDEIACQLLIPSHLLTFKYGSQKTIATVKFPYAWTCRLPV